jgi:glucosamine-6-phosphate deaminase
LFSINVIIVFYIVYIAYKKSQKSNKLINNQRKRNGLHIMKTIVEMNKQLAGKAAAEAASKVIIRAIKENGQANIVLATGTSQFQMLENLVKGEYNIDWTKVVMFHLDEYIGLDMDHPASFRRYLRFRFLYGLKQQLKAVYFIEGDAESPEAECQRLNEIIAKHPIDVALIGIGENGHLAFNDPPADFETEEPYIIVELDERCRAQQFDEGWFNTLEEVPETAISMSIRQIMKSSTLIVTVPEKRKAEAVKNAVEGEVTNMCPASILQQHKNCTLVLDRDAASGIDTR